jgi:predicted secreted protein
MTTMTFNPWRNFTRLVLMALCLFSLMGLSGCPGDSSNPMPASISAQPSSASVVAGAAATFSVVAAGDELSYQWQRSTDGGTVWADVAGATAASYTISAPNAAMSGHKFRVTITGPNSSLTSSAVTLTVAAAAAAPQISVQPADQTAVAGSTAAFSVTATGTGLAYQWQSSANGSTWTDFSGATNATLSLPALTPADNGKRVRVVVSNSTGNVTSAAALLTVNAASAAPVVNTAPASISVQAPQSASFSVVASGNPTPTYQWQVSSDNGASFVDVPSATSASYTTPATSTADSGKRYRVQVSNTQGQVLSAAAQLTVTAAAAAPTISSQPANQTVTEPASATFSVTATGTPSPTYQWQLSSDAGANFANINGATAASYTTPATAASDSGKRWRVVVSNSSSSITSAAATLTVNVSGGGGGGGGSGAGACFYAGAFTTGLTAQVVSSNSATPGQTTTLNLRVNGPALFQGQSLLETQSDITTSAGGTTSSVKSYSDSSSSSGVFTSYGSVGRTTTTLAGFSSITDISTLFTPPFVSRVGTLGVGQSITETATESITTTTTLNGVVGAPTTRVDTTTTTTRVVALERVTVPAGSFNTCKVEITSPNQTGVYTIWLLVNYGLQVKSEAAGVTTSATSITVNGATPN